MIRFTITFPIKDNEIARMWDIVSSSPSMLLLVKVYPATNNSGFRTNPGLDAATFCCNIGCEACTPMDMTIKSIPSPELLSADIANLS